MTKENSGMTTFLMKWIAVLTMITDHVGRMFFPDVHIFNIIGRIAFPLFAFLLVEGFVHTGNLKKYMLRMFIFACISEIPYDLAMQETWLEFSRQNTIWTLTLGLLMLALCRKYQYSVWAVAGIAVVCCAAAALLRFDYGAGGIVLILILYFLRDRQWLKYLAMLGLSVLWFGGTEIAAMISIIFMLAYNGKHGKNMKYMFYWFYPVHLVVLFFIKILI